MNTTDNYPCRVVYVVDGDTTDVEASSPLFGRRTERIRHLGYNTPERGKDGFHEATELCADWIAKNSPVGTNHPLRVRFLLKPDGIRLLTDKYGRIVAELHTAQEGTETLNEYMVRMGYGVPVEDQLMQLIEPDTESEISHVLDTLGAKYDSILTTANGGSA